MFDEDAMRHKKQLVIVISTSAQGDDLRTVLTVITYANFKTVLKLDGFIYTFLKLKLVAKIPGSSGQGPSPPPLHPPPQ
jgi:hypothetical protein